MSPGTCRAVRSRLSANIGACLERSSHRVDPSHVQHGSSAFSHFSSFLQARGTVAQLNPINAILPGQARHESCRRDQQLPPPYNPRFCIEPAVLFLNSICQHAGVQISSTLFSASCKDLFRCNWYEVDSCRHAAETGHFGVCQVHAAVHWVCGSLSSV